MYEADGRLLLGFRGRPHAKQPVMMEHPVSNRRPEDENKHTAWTSTQLYAAYRQLHALPDFVRVYDVNRQKTPRPHAGSPMFLPDMDAGSAPAVQPKRKTRKHRKPRELAP